jgi:uncharacterized protein YukE
VGGGGGLSIDGAGVSAGGQKFIVYSHTLRAAANQLCDVLAAAGPVWGKDDLGQAFASGDGSRPGFGTSLSEVMSQTADMVNALANTGAGLQMIGIDFPEFDQSLSSVVASMQVTPAALEKGLSALNLQLTPPDMFPSGLTPSDLSAYKLPPYTGASAAGSDPPPPDWLPYIGVLEAVSSYQPPDGSENYLSAISSQLTYTSKVTDDVSANVKSQTAQLIAINRGASVESFADLGAELVLTLQWFADAYQGLAGSVQNLVNQKQSAWDQLSKAVAVLSDDEHRLGTVVQANLGAAEQQYYDTAQQEAQSLLASREVLVYDVLTGLSVLPTPPSGQQVQKMAGRLARSAPAAAQGKAQRRGAGRRGRAVCSRRTRSGPCRAIAGSAPHDPRTR